MRLFTFCTLSILLIANTACTAMAVVSTAASVASTAVSVTATAVKATGKVAGAIVDAAIPDSTEKKK
jgi:hypothetical protein